MFHLTLITRYDILCAMSDNVRYNAFISYRHCEPDKTIAKALHRKLENYRIPRELREKLGRNVLGRVFRDEAELPVTDSLSDAILEALRESEYLIVICSPRLKESAWCMKEIEIFTKLHGKKKILPVLIEGEPEDSFPETFFYEDIVEKDPEGNEVTVRIEKEPLAADCRGGRKGLIDSVIKLSAAMLGLNYDDLKQRHRVERLKRRTFFTGIIFAVVLVFLVQSLYFVNTIQKQKLEIEKKYADSMANTSKELLRSGDRMTALYVARSVLPDEQKGYVSPVAFHELVNATHVYSSDHYVADRVVAESYIYGDVVFSPECRMAVTDELNTTRLVDMETGETVYNFKSSRGQYGFYHNEGLAYYYDGKVWYYDIEEDERTILMEDEAWISSSPAGDLILLFTGEGIYAFKGTDQVYFTDLSSMGVCELSLDTYLECYYSDDEKYALVRIRQYDENGLDSEWILQTDLESGKIVAFIDDMYAAGLADHEVEVLDLDTDGKRLYLLVGKTDYSGEKLLCCYDINKKKITEQVELGKENFAYLYYIDHEIVILSNDRVVIYDENLEYANSFGVPNYPDEVFRLEGMLVVNNMKGEIYSAELDDAGRDITLDFFEDAPVKDVAKLQCYGDHIYIKYAGGEGIVVYTKAPGNAFTKCEENRFPLFYEEDGTEEMIRKEFEGLEGFDMDQYLIGNVSSDGKYYIVFLADGYAALYDAETMERIKVIYENISYCYCFDYLEKYNCYVLVDGDLEVLNEDFEIVMTIRDVWDVEYDPDDEGKFYVLRNNGLTYELHFLSYEEVIRYADELLDGFEPSQRMKEKYGF